MILRALPLAASYRRRHRASFETPLAISFLVTNRCMLKCKHCFYHEAMSGPRDELTFAQFESLSANLGDFMVAVFAGGEPFIRPDIGEIITLFRTNNALPFAGVASNGHQTGPIVRQTEAICRSDTRKLFNFALSLDGFQPEHDRIRGHGSFDKALRTWHELKRLARHQSNLLLTITAVINTLNQERMPDFVHWVARELEPAAVNVMLVRQSPRAGDHIKRVDPALYRAAQDAAVSAAARFRILRGINPLARFLGAIGDGVHETMLTGKRSFHCFAGVHGAVVLHNGDLHVCEVLAEDPAHRRIGNLRDVDMDFLGLWNSPRAQQMRRQVNCHAACQGCTHETMGYLPSLAFAPNKLGFVFGRTRRSAA